MRYIPELQSLCAKEIAKQCRKLSYEDRYNFLKSIPSHLRELVKCFPTDFIVWCGNEMLLNKNVLKFYINHQNKRHYIVNGFIEDCEKGITRRKVIWRKCANYYCENSYLDKIISTPYSIYWNLCKECKRYLIYHHKLMKIHLKIKNIF